MESSWNPLLNKGKMVIKYFLPDFLDIPTLMRFKQTWKHVYEAICETEKVWVNQFRIIAHKYSLDVSQWNKEDVKYYETKFHILPKNKEDAWEKNMMFRSLKYPTNYVMFLQSGNMAYCSELRGMWSWNDDKRYYESIDIYDSIFTPRIPIPVRAYKFSVNMYIRNVPKGKYTLYIRHLLEHNTNFVDTLKLTVEIEYIQTEKSLSTSNPTIPPGQPLSITPVFCLQNFPCEEMLSPQENQLKEENFKFSHDWLGDVDVGEDPPDGARVDLRVGLSSKMEDSKFGYMIDGIVLIPEGDEYPQNEPTIKKFLDEIKITH